MTDTPKLALSVAPFSDHVPRICDSNGEVVACMGVNESELVSHHQEKAALIIKCVNEHDRLAERELAFLRLMDADHCNWTRWHDLMTIRSVRGLGPDEQIEYDAFSKFVAMLDERDDALSHAAEKTG